MVADLKLFISDPDPDPTWRVISDPDPDSDPAPGSFLIRVRIRILICDMFVKFLHLKSVSTFKGHFWAEIELFMLKLVFLSLHLSFKRPDPIIISDPDPDSTYQLILDPDPDPGS